MAGPIVVRTKQPPLQRTRRTSKVVRSLIDIDAIFGQPTAIYFALDASGSMSYSEDEGVNQFPDSPENSRWFAQLTGVINLLRAIKNTLNDGQQESGLVTENGDDFFVTESGAQFETEDVRPTVTHSLYITFFPYFKPEYPDFERYDASFADFDDAIAFLSGDMLSTWFFPKIDPSSGGGTPYDQGVDEAPSFFATAAQSQRVVMFFSDGEPIPPSSAQNAKNILDGISDVDVYLYRFLVEGTGGNIVDNTPEDGIPVMSTLDSLSWGTWSALLTPTSFVVPATTVDPEISRNTSALIMGARVENTSGTEQTISLRIRNIVTGDETFIGRLDVASGAMAYMPIEGDIVNSGDVLEARTSLGGEIKVSVDYLEILQETIE